MNPDNLLSLKDDMIAFIEGHGMRHFPAVIPEDTPRVWWNEKPLAGPGNRQAAAESWKDFVEMAKAVGSPMVCLGEDTIDQPTLELLSEELEELSDEDGDLHARSVSDSGTFHTLFLHIGKLGHIELAFALNGVLFVHETSTDWYRNYREMVDRVDELQELIEQAFDDGNEDEE